MKKNPLITVFITAYNSEKYINATIESVLKQTYRNMEILIVDDGSTDRTTEIIKSYDDSRIRLINNETNMGIPYSRNIGLEEAKGNFIAIIDADDIAYPERLEKQLLYLYENPDIDVVATNYKTLGNRFPRVQKTKITKPEEVEIYLMFYNNIANPTVMIRKTTLEKHNIRYNEDYFVAQDYELWSQISKVGKIAVMPKTLTKYRVGHLNISRHSKNHKSVERKELIDTIHTNLLRYYGFQLTSKEEMIFNELFNDNISTDVEIDPMEFFILVDKILKINKIQKIYKQSRFEYIFYYALNIAIDKGYLKRLEKLKLIYKLNRLVHRKNKISYLKFLMNQIIRDIKKII